MEPSEEERKKAVYEFEKYVRGLQQKQSPYSNPKVFKTFGYPGKDSVIRNKFNNHFLKVHTTESGTMYVIDRNGARRKATPELIDKLTKELEMIAQVQPTSIIDQPDTPTLVPTDKLVQSEDERK